MTSPVPGYVAIPLRTTAAAASAAHGESSFHAAPIGRPTASADSSAFLPLGGGGGGGGGNSSSHQQPAGVSRSYSSDRRALHHHHQQQQQQQQQCRIVPDPPTHASVSSAQIAATSAPYAHAPASSASGYQHGSPSRRIVPSAAVVSSSSAAAAAAAVPPSSSSFAMANQSVADLTFSAAMNGSAVAPRTGPAARITPDTLGTRNHLTTSMTSSGGLRGLGGGGVGHAINGANGGTLPPNAAVQLRASSSMKGQAAGARGRPRSADGRSASRAASNGKSFGGGLATSRGRAHSLGRSGFDPPTTGLFEASRGVAAVAAKSKKHRCRIADTKRQLSKIAAEAAKYDDEIAAQEQRLALAEDEKNEMILRLCHAKVHCETLIAAKQTVQGEISTDLAAAHRAQKEKRLLSKQRFDLETAEARKYNETKEKERQAALAGKEAARLAQEVRRQQEQLAQEGGAQEERELSLERMETRLRVMKDMVDQSMGHALHGTRRRS